MITILLADNQAIFRAGTARVLASQSDICVEAQCERPQDLLPMLEGCRDCILIAAAVVVTDLPHLLSVTAANRVRLVLLTDGNDEPAPAVAKKIDGLLSRHTSAEDLLRCIRRVAAGERVPRAISDTPEDATGRRIRDSLTARELQIVGYIVQGWKNRQIAEEIGTKEQVVKNYLRSIYDKTGASDRLELALFTLHHRVLAEAAAKTVGPAATASH